MADLGGLNPEKLNGKDTKKAFAKFISGRKILIADADKSSRAGLARALANLGAKSMNLFMAENYSTAQMYIEEHKPHIVVCEYDLGKQCGLNLLQEQRASRPESKDTLFVLVTGNTSQSAVAQAAEEDVDSFIIKPYTIDTLRNTIFQSALAKLYPSDYVKKIEQGKKIMVEGDIDGAMTLFKEAATLDAKPALAHFYMGQAETMKQIMEEAKGSYKKGLDYNKIHYKCLVGLFELLMEQKQFQEAYDVVKKISHYFPANPKRLASVVRLAVMNHKVEDMERYYQIFTNIDTRSEELTKAICAGLIVCGKYYLKGKHKKRALDLFNGAAVSSKGNPKFLKEIIMSLADAGAANDAKKFMVRFPAEATKGAEYLGMQLLIASIEKPPGHVIEQGRKILTEGAADPVIYETLIKVSHAAGQADYAEHLLHEGTKKFPKYEKMFQTTYDKHKKDEAESKAA